MNKPVTHPFITQPRRCAAVSAAVHLLALNLVLAAPCLAVHAEPPAAFVQPATVERTVLSRQAGVTSYALSNGVDIHLRPMPKPGTARAHIAVMVPGLELDETAAERGSTMLAIDALLPAGGSANGSGAAPAPKLRAVQRPEGLLLTAACTAAEIEPILKQVAATLTDPVFDEAAFNSSRQRAVLQQTAVDARADQQAAEAMLRLMTPADDARLRRPTPDQLAAVKFAAATARLRTLLTARAIDVAVVGDIDPPAVAKTAAAALGSLPARQRDRLAGLRAVKRLPLQPAQVDSVAEGTRPLLTISLPAPPIANLAESRLAAVAARLMERQVAEALRESGLTVNVASGVAMTGRTYPDLGAVIGSFVLAGDDAHLRAAARVARARLTSLIEQGPTTAQLKRAIETAAAEIEPRIDTADYWSQSLAMAWFLNVSIDELGSAPAAIRAVTRQSIREHMTRWWQADQTFTVTILPVLEEAPAPSQP